MNKILTRFVALLVIFCLVADPLTASALKGPLASGRACLPADRGQSLLGVRGNSAAQNLFQEQALCAAVLEFLFSFQKSKSAEVRSNIEKPATTAKKISSLPQSKPFIRHVDLLNENFPTPAPNTLPRRESKRTISMAELHQENFPQLETLIPSDADPYFLRHKFDLKQKFYAAAADTNYIEATKLAKMWVENMQALDELGDHIWDQRELRPWDLVILADEENIYVGKLTKRSDLHWDISNIDARVRGDWKPVTLEKFVVYRFGDDQGVFPRLIESAPPLAMIPGIGKLVLGLGLSEKTAAVLTAYLETGIFGSIFVTFASVGLHFIFPDISLEQFIFGTSISSGLFFSAIHYDVPLYYWGKNGLERREGTDEVWMRILNLSFGFRILYALTYAGLHYSHPGAWATLWVPFLAEGTAHALYNLLTGGPLAMTVEFQKDPSAGGSPRNPVPDALLQPLSDIVMTQRDAKALGAEKEIVDDGRGFRVTYRNPADSTDYLQITITAPNATGTYPCVTKYDSRNGITIFFYPHEYGVASQADNSYLLLAVIDRLNSLRRDARWQEWLGRLPSAHGPFTPLPDTQRRARIVKALREEYGVSAASVDELIKGLEAIHHHIRWLMQILDERQPRDVRAQIILQVSDYLWNGVPAPGPKGSGTFKISKISSLEPTSKWDRRDMPSNPLARLRGDVEFQKEPSVGGSGWRDHYELRATLEEQSHIAMDLLMQAASLILKHPLFHNLPLEIVPSETPSEGVRVQMLNRGAHGIRLRVSEHSHYEILLMPGTFLSGQIIALRMGTFVEAAFLGVVAEFLKKYSQEEKDPQIVAHRQRLMAA